MFKIAGVLLLFLTRWIYVGLGSVVVIAVAAMVGGHYDYLHYAYLFDITAFVVAVVLVSLHAYGVKFVSKFLQKQQIKKQFGSYYSGSWSKALKMIPECKNAAPDMEKYYDAMADRLEQGRPKTWLGYFVATSK
jgi:hypothetical protein